MAQFLQGRFRVGEGSTNREREARVRGGLWSNWGADDTDEKVTVWHREVCGDGQLLLCTEEIVGMLAHGVYGTTVIKKHIY